MKKFIFSAIVLATVCFSRHFQLCLGIQIPLTSMRLITSCFQGPLNISTSVCLAQPLFIHIFLLGLKPIFSLSQGGCGHFYLFFRSPQTFTSAATTWAAGTDSTFKVLFPCSSGTDPLLATSSLTSAHTPVQTTDHPKAQQGRGLQWPTSIRNIWRS